jgi:F-type H+-transporting ATPase subunit b
MANAVDTVFAADSGGNFLVTPNVGLMIWTLIAFGIALFLLQRLAFPRIGEALEKRRKAIEESIEAAERTRREADDLLEEYRARLGERLEQDAVVEAKQEREELMARTRREIEQETRRAIEEIRKEVADLTVLATEKLARKTLTGEDQRRLVEEALEEIDFSSLAPANGGSED